MIEKHTEGFIDCCKKCKSRNVDQDHCYQDRPCFECPEYKKADG